MSDDPNKLPEPSEDANHDGLVDRPHPTVVWWLWFTDALTVFANGVLDSTTVGTVVGGGNAAVSDETTPQGISVKIALGFLAVTISGGLREFGVWRRSNPMPNPFRTTTQSAHEDTPVRS